MHQSTLFMMVAKQKCRRVCFRCFSVVVIEHPYLCQIMTELLEIPYIRVNELDVIVDIYIPANASSERPVPAVVWWHGGGLVQGTRKGEYT